jgi:integrase
MFKTEALQGSPLIPLSVPDCALFVAYLFSKRYAPATIATYLSAVCFVMKWLGHNDPSSNFVIKKLLGAAQNLKSQVDIRLPITRGILIRLLGALPIVCPPPYQHALFAAMFHIAFAAFLRIGEIAPKTFKVAQNCLQVQDVTFARGEVLVSVLRFKTSKSQGPQCIQLTSKAPPCPLATLHRYYSMRGLRPGPFFVHQSGRPVLRREFDQILRRALILCDLDSSRFKGHSFRIGAASEAASQGCWEGGLQTHSVNILESTKGAFRVSLCQGNPLFILTVSGCSLKNLAHGNLLYCCYAKQFHLMSQSQAAHLISYTIVCIMSHYFVKYFY